MPLTSYRFLLIAVQANSNCWKSTRLGVQDLQRTDLYLKIQWLFKNINAQELVLEVQADSSGCKKKDSDDLDPPVSGSKSDDG